MIKKNMVCIVCPLGCTMEVEMGEEIKVAGNTCKRGLEYAVKECTNPTRTITTTVGITQGELPVIPVKTSGEVPKDKIADCMQVLRKTRIPAPVKNGEVVVSNILGTGVDIIAIRDVGVKIE